MSGILNLFARSPFGPTQDHMKAVQRCVEFIGPLTDAICDGDQHRIEELAAKISEQENEADRLKHQIRNHLPKALFLPIDRRDLLEILHLQDSIADSLEETCHLLTLKPLKLPALLHDDFRALTGEIERTCRGMGAVVEHLGDLVVTGFSGREADRVLAMIEEIDLPDTRAEDQGRQIVKRMFALKDDLGALDAMLWYQVFTQIGQVANFAEREASRLRLLIAKA